MAKKAKKARVAGAYIVKAAESRPSRVEGRSVGKATMPTSEDKSLADALLRARAER